MLDTLMLATEPFGTWGPGRVQPESTWWGQTISHPTIIAAFLGFFGGVLIKFLLELWLDGIRSRRARQILATALRAELVQMDSECSSRIEAFEELLNQNPEAERLGGPHSFARMALPPRRIWMAHLSRIGELKGVDPEVLALVYAAFDSHNLVVETLSKSSGDKGVGRGDLQNRVDQLRRIRLAIAEAGASLINLTNASSPWWRRLFSS